MARLFPLARAVRGRRHEPGRRRPAAEAEEAAAEGAVRVDDGAAARRAACGRWRRCVDDRVDDRRVDDRAAAAAATTRDAAIYELFYSSGLRLAELVALDVAYADDGVHRSTGWLDRSSAEVTVTGKGGKRRTVPVGAKALDAIARWLAVRGAWLKADPHPLFVSRRGERLSGRTIQARLKAHARAAGVPANVHPHVLRHSFASHLLQASGDLRAVQELLGHASIAATQVYTSLDFKRLAEVYDAAHPRARRK